MIWFSTDNLPYEKVGKNEPVCIADEVPFEIPETWEWVHLSDIAISGLGKTLNKSIDNGKDTPYLCSINVYWTGIDLTTVKTAKFTQTDRDKYLLQKGDLLICEGGDVGRSAVWNYDREMYYQNALHRVRFLGKINPYFFLYLLECYKGLKIIEEYSKGVTIKHFVQSSLNAMFLPLPPLNEQQRIVDKINEVMPVVAKYDTTYSKVTELNETFPEALKRSILQWAIQGNLVPQDPADEPAEALLERIRVEKQRLIKEGKIKKDKHESVIFRRDNSHYEKRGSDEVCIDEEIPFEIPTGWNWSRLGTCLDVRDGTHDTPRYVAEGVPLVTSKNLSNGKIDFTTAKLISREDSQAINQRSNVESGDIMYAMIGSIGNPVLYQGNDEFSIKNMALFKRVPNGMDMEYVYWFLVLVQEDMKKAASGGVQSFVSLGYLRNYLIPVPPIAEQKRICSTIGQIIPLLAGL